MAHALQAMHLRTAFSWLRANQEWIGSAAYHRVPSPFLKDLYEKHLACDRSDGSLSVVNQIDAHEFIRRFLLHVLPSGFQRIRHYGFLANRYRQIKVALCLKLLGVPKSPALNGIWLLGSRIQSNFRLLGHLPPIIHFNAEVARGTLDRRANSAQRSRSSGQLKQTALNEVIPIRATQLCVLHAPNKGLTRCGDLMQDAASVEGCG